MAPKYSNKLQGKRVLIIGGTSGIGFCVAEACVEFGAIVTVASSRQENIDKTINRITTSYPDAADRISGHACNLASDDQEAALKTLFEFATKDGKLDHLVFTAGNRFGLVKLADLTAANIQEYGYVRYVGSLLMAKLAPSYMHKTNLSSITTTGGVNSTKPSENWISMSGWGAAMEGMTRSLAVELTPIRVNIVAPGAIVTELWDGFGDDAQKKEIIEYYKSKTLLKAVGQPEDTAEAYLYLMRDAFVTGITHIQDGGYLLV